LPNVSEPLFRAGHVESACRRAFFTKDGHLGPWPFRAGLCPMRYWYNTQSDSVQSWTLEGCKAEQSRHFARIARKVEPRPLPIRYLTKAHCSEGHSRIAALFPLTHQTQKARMERRGVILHLLESGLRRTRWLPELGIRNA